ncbi:hypothetical protein EVAR_87418_1 [Eumeta japonica]|uniref:Uncharacterized protein n=1 Tax=Eumeta variegata TaxID=151549 RepID=A0A4C1XGM6_EUMVA|nr:hypothetical protein EVAR_87418_1 [Eumeta japonica]
MADVVTCRNGVTTVRHERRMCSTKHRAIAISCNRMCERVEHVGPLDRAEKSRVNPTVSPYHVTRAFHCDVIA